jgi:hypothetical protein
MNHSEAVKLIDEIAAITPDLIKNAKEVSIDCWIDNSCRLVFRTDLSESQRFNFSYNFCGRGFSLAEKSAGVWEIF